MTADSLKKGKKGKAGDSAELVLQISNLETENESLRERLTKSVQEATEFKEKVADLGAQLMGLEKGEVEATLRLARKRQEELEQEILAKTAINDAVLAKNDEALKNKSHTQKMQLQLYQENEELQNQVCINRNCFGCISNMNSLNS